MRIKDLDALQKELNDDYIINKGLSALASNLALKCGQMPVGDNVVLLTTIHIDFSAEQKKPEQSSATAK